ncbi:MAG TPA: response regulator [Thermoleophilaceae bacterium]|nr:response regulator [Thermoleophilaceae bacterium]
MATTILIVDDHDGFRSRARRMLEAEGFDVVGEAGSASAAAEAVRDLRPSLVLLDVQLPDGNGFDLADRLLADGRDAPAVVLTSTRDAVEYGPLVTRSRARGFIPKGELTAAGLRALLE